MFFVGIASTTTDVHIHSPCKRREDEQAEEDGSYDDWLPEMLGEGHFVCHLQIDVGFKFESAVEIEDAHRYGRREDP